VSYCRAHGPAGITDTCLLCDVRECTVVVVMKESASCLFPSERHGNTRRIGEVNIEPAVAVVVEQSNTTAHRLDDVLLLWAGEMLEVNAGRGRDVHQLRHALAGTG